MRGVSCCADNLQRIWHPDDPDYDLEHTMDDTDGPKHCGEAEAHMPHEYEIVLMRQEPGGTVEGHTRLWSCDGTERGTPGPRREKKLPEDIRVGAMEVSTIPVGEGLTEVVVSMRYIVDHPQRLEATMRVLEVLR